MCGEPLETFVTGCPPLFDSSRATASLARLSDCARTVRDCASLNACICAIFASRQFIVYPIHFRRWPKCVTYACIIKDFSSIFQSIGIQLQNAHLAIQLFSVQSFGFRTKATFFLSRRSVAAADVAVVDGDAWFGALRFEFVGSALIYVFFLATNEAVFVLIPIRPAVPNCSFALELIRKISQHTNGLFEKGDLHQARMHLSDNNVVLFASKQEKWTLIAAMD